MNTFSKTNSKNLARPLRAGLAARTLALLLLLFFLGSMTACGESNSSPSSPSSPSGDGDGDSDKKKPKTPSDDDDVPPDDDDNPPPDDDDNQIPEELQGLFDVTSGIAREMKGINFGTQENPIWGQEDWVHYYKPWQKDEDNWYARVKAHIPLENGENREEAFLVWCHYHGEDMYCHVSTNTRREDLGDEPLDEDYPEDQPVDEEECNPLDDPDCDPF